MPGAHACDSDKSLLEDGARSVLYLASTRRVADIALLASIVASLSISTIAASQLLTEQSAMFMPGLVSQDNADTFMEQSQSADQREGTSEGQMFRDPSPGSDSEGIRADGLYGGYVAVPDNGASPSAGQNYHAAGSYSLVYESSPYILPITWGAVAGTLIWRGKVRSQWCKQGYDYDMFKMLARMKGSPIRVALLTSISKSARTRAQLAGDLDVDWKTIDNHIDVLSKNGLAQEIGAFGTSRYFAITEHGRRVLSLLLTLDSDGAANVSGSVCHDITAEFQQANPRQSMNSPLN